MFPDFMLTPKVRTNSRWRKRQTNRQTSDRKIDIQIDRYVYLHHADYEGYYEEQVCCGELPPAQDRPQAEREQNTHAPLQQQHCHVRGVLISLPFQRPVLQSRVSCHVFTLYCFNVISGQKGPAKINGTGGLASAVINNSNRSVSPYSPTPLPSHLFLITPLMKVAI